MPGSPENARSPRAVVANQIAATHPPTEIRRSSGRRRGVADMG
jgi:hypothetical protein